MITTLTTQQKTFTVIGSLLALLLAALDSTIVSSAGPVIQQKLEINSAFYTLITTAYLVGEVVTLPIYGKMGDIFGRRRVLLIGIVLFLIGSMLCGISNSAITLIVSRLIQGLGAGALINTCFAVIADIFPPSERGKYQGIFGATFGMSSVVGPLLGGWLTDTFGWQSIFFVNLPIGLIALAFIASKMPELRFGNPNGKIDWLGVFWLAVFVFPLLLALSFGSSNPIANELSFAWLSIEILGLFALSVVGLIAFIVTELRVQEPILELRLFRNQTFTIANLGSFVFGGVFLGAIIFLPVFMVNVVGLSATNSGLTILPLSFGIVLGNIVSGALASRLGSVKGILIGAGVLCVIGYLLLGTTLSAQSSTLELTWKMVLLGFGLGPAIPLFTLAVQSAVEPSRIGEATGANGFFRQIGLTIGLAVLGSVFADGITKELQPRLEAATAALPANLKAQFANTGSGGGKGASVTKFEPETIKREIATNLELQKTLVTAAIQNGDIKAIATLMADQNTPPETKERFAQGSIQNQISQVFKVQRDLTTRAIQNADQKAINTLLKDQNTSSEIKTRFANGSIQSQIATGFNAQLKAIEAVISSRSPQAWQGLLNDSRLPEQLRIGLQRIPFQALGAPQTLSAIKTQLETAQKIAIKTATQTALTSALDGLERGEVSAIKTATRSALEAALNGLNQAQVLAFKSIDQVGIALKDGFTLAISKMFQIAVLIALLGCFITIFLPKVILRDEQPGAAH